MRAHAAAHRPWSHPAAAPQPPQPRASTSYQCASSSGRGSNGVSGAPSAPHRFTRRRGGGAIGCAAPRAQEALFKDASMTGSYYEEACPNTWRAPLQCDVGETDTPHVIVALGKFDALHRGHRSLVERAAQMGGHPYMLSFSGMAQVLGYPIRPPLVAPCDRARVLHSWACACAGRPPRQRSVPFREIREMSAKDFVAVLANDLHAKGVVAGANYRFGYKAAGNADTLRSLGKQYGLSVSIVDLLGASNGSGQVSSTKTRKLLAAGDVKGAASLLGRFYRVVACFEYHGDATAAPGAAASNGAQAPPPPPPQAQDAAARTRVLPVMTLLNQIPGDGLYEATLSAVYRGAVPPLSRSGARSNSNADPNAPGYVQPCAGSPAEGLATSLPLDLDSGIGLPLMVRCAPDGLHLPADAFDVAMSAALPSRGLPSGAAALYIVLDFTDAVSLEIACKI